jgi:large subunit ribosomal protein L15
MLQLNNLTAIVKKRKRIGRGGSRGGTAGRGTKGQNARSGGGVRILFEGGQMPLHRRLPKRGFNNNRFKKVFEIVSLEIIESAFSDGETVNRESLMQKGIINAPKGSLIKILGGFELTKKVHASVDALSKSAHEAIAKAGGSVELTKES